MEPQHLPTNHPKTLFSPRPPKSEAELLVDRKALVAHWISEGVEATQEAKRERLAHFARWLEMETYAAAYAFLDFTQRQAYFTAKQYRQHMLDEGQAPNSINARLTTLRTLSAEAHKAEVTDWILSIRSVPAELVRDVKGPNWDYVEKYLKGHEARAFPNWLRDRAMVHLAGLAGLRRVEIMRLNVEDLRLADSPPTVRVQRKHRKHKNRIALAARAAGAVNDWLIERGNFDGALFLNPENGQRLGERSVTEAIKRYTRRVGLEMRPHQLRHACLTRAVEATADVKGIGLPHVAEFAGHKSPTTLQRYIDDLEEKAAEVAKLTGEAPLS